MAELLVRVVDKVNVESIYLDCGCTKRGDVIVVRPDGWAWGRCELNDPQYVVVRVPDMSLTEAEALTTPDPGFGMRGASPTLHKRAFKWDLDQVVAAPLESAIQQNLNAATPDPQHPGQTSPKSVILSPLTVIELRLIKTVKPSTPDPAVIGDDPHVIG